MSIGSEGPLRSLCERSGKLRLMRRWSGLLSLVMAGIVGCSDNVKLPTPQELIEFETLGRSEPAVDISRLVKARLESRPYRVVPSEVLELTMPSILQTVTVDEAADPRYAVIYPLDSQGQIQHVAYNIQKSKNDTLPASPMTVPIKPGDIVAVEHTRRTRTKIVLDRIFHVNLGAYVPILR